MNAEVPNSGVNSRDADLRAAYFAIERAQSKEARAAAQALFDEMVFARRQADEGYKAVALLATKGDEAKAERMLEAPIAEIKNAACHKQAVMEARRACGMDNYGMRHSLLFVNLCDEYSIDEISHAIQGACNKEKNIVV